MPVTNYKKVLILILFTLGLNSVSRAQSGNLLYVDDKFIHFGFSLGMNTMDFGIGSSLQTIDGNVYHVDVSTLKPGFSVGIISDMRLARYLNLRFTPTLHFGERQLNYISQNSRDSITITSIPIALPIYLKYSAERKGNIRPYLLWGAGVSIDLATNKENPVLLKPIDVYTEFGVGCDLYFSFFKLAPELKFGVGFNDLFTPLDLRDAGQISQQDQKFSLALSRLTSRILTLSFNFE